MWSTLTMAIHSAALQIMNPQQFKNCSVSSLQSSTHWAPLLSHSLHTGSAAEPLLHCVWRRKQTVSCECTHPVSAAVCICIQRFWVLLRPVGWLNSEDDLEAWWCPGQGSSHPGPQSDLLCQAAAAHRHTFSAWQLVRREERRENLQQFPVQDGF